MKLTINNETTDYTLENEEFLPEIIQSIALWLEKEGHILTSIAVDGRPIPEDALDSLATIDIQSVKNLDVGALPWLHIYQEALEEFSRIFSLAFNEIGPNWLSSPSESFLLLKDRQLHEIATAFIGREAETSQDDQELLSRDFIQKLVHSRLQDIQNPLLSLNRLKKSIENIVPEMENLPLLLQTGKNRDASFNISLFTSLVEDMLRLIPILKSYEIDINNKKIEAEDFPDWMEGFLNVLTEFVEGYENSDIILVGDLAEYEIAPKLKQIIRLFNSILEEKS